jgi:hypothetical protein
MDSVGEHHDLAEREKRPFGGSILSRSLDPAWVAADNAILNRCTAGSGLGRPARRSGPGRLTPIRRSKRLIAAAIGRQAHASTFILPS